MKKRRKKEFKTYELDEKYGPMIIGFLIILIVIMVWILINVVKTNKITYTYHKDGNKGISKECYQIEKQDNMCLIGDNFVSVDQYYTVD